jgi:hypothetical protein
LSKAVLPKGLPKRKAFLHNEVSPKFLEYGRGFDRPRSVVQLNRIKIMSGSYRKLFRESHRDFRLKPWQPGHDTSFEVRPLSLTPSSSKIMRIKDQQKSNETKS